MFGLKQHLLVWLLVGVAVTLSPDFMTFDRNNVQINGEDFFKENTTTVNWIDLVSAVYKVCDHIQTCPKLNTTVEQFDRVSSCCIPCDCSDDCKIFGTCCGSMNSQDEDIEHSNHSTETGETCIISPFSNMTENKTLDMFMMVAECPPNYVGVDRCTNGSSLTWDDAVPVTNHLTGITYMNRHCANCNNQTRDLVSWSPFLNCERFIPANYLVNPKVTNIQELITTYNCELDWTHNKLAKTCYTTDQRNICYNKDYFKYCKVIPRNGFFVDTFIINIFNSNCLELAMSSFEMPGFQIPIISISFTAMLRFDSGSDETVQSSKLDQMDTMSTGVCPTKKDGCLERVCSPSQVTSQGGMCIDVIQYMYGLCLDFRVKVVLRSNTVWINASMTDILKETENSLFLDILSTYGDGLYSELAAIDTDGSSIIYHIRIQGKPLTGVSVRDELKSFDNQIEQFSKNEEFLIKLDVDNRAFKPMPLEEVNYVSYSDGLSVFDCWNVVAMHKIQFCDSVLISAEEYRIEDGNVVVLSHGQRFQQNQYIIRTNEFGYESVQVCLEDLVMEIASGCSKLSIQWLCIVPVLKDMYGILTVFLILLYSDKT